MTDHMNPLFLKMIRDERNVINSQMKSCRLFKEASLDLCS